MSQGKPTTQTETKPNKMNKSNLNTLLFALGGALRGDKDFVAKAIQLKEMKASKEKKNQQEEAWKTWKENNLDSIPDTFKSLVNIMDADQGINLVVKTLEPPKTLSTAQRVSEIAAKVANDPNYKLTKQDELILQISRKADPLTRGIEDISAESLRLQSMQQTQPGAIKTITTQAEYDALEEGEEYINNGIRYKKGE
jgi:lipopolysaccharide biosynthesis regulator YciM